MVTPSLAMAVIAFICTGSRVSKPTHLTRLFSTVPYRESTLISSTKSNTVKKIQALLNKRKKRLEQRETVAEGPRMVVDLLKQPQTHHLVRSIFIASDKWEQYYPEILRAVGEDESRLPLTLPVTPPVFAACSDTITPQGILAITEIPIFSLERRDAPQNPLYLVLDGVSDPGNLGTLLRSSVATGVAGVLLLPGSCDPWAPKAIRSAMGTTFQIPVETFENWDECREKLVHLGCNNLWAATMLEDGVGRSHYEVNWLSGPNALIIGSEGNGLTKPIRDDLAATSPRLKSVYVPMKAGIESLNAAVCGSVILFEYMRQGETNVSTK